MEILGTFMIGMSFILWSPIFITIWALIMDFMNGMYHSLDEITDTPFAIWFALVVSLFSGLTSMIVGLQLWSVI